MSRTELKVTSPNTIRMNPSGRRSIWPSQNRALKVLKKRSVDSFTACFHDRTAGGDARTTIRNVDVSGRGLLESIASRGRLAYPARRWSTHRQGTADLPPGGLGP